MESPFQIRTIPFENGERFPVMLNRESGMPLFLPTIYLVSMIRGKGGQVATLQLHLRAIKFLYTWGAQCSIDIDERFRSGDFLRLNEIDLLASDVRKRADNLNQELAGSEKTPSAAPRSKVAKMENYRKQTQHRTEEMISGSTAGTRFRYIRDYLDWMALQRLTRFNPNTEKYYAVAYAREEMKKAFDSRIPSNEKRDDFHVKLGLTLVDEKRLLEVIEPDFPENPWQDIRICYRNRLIIQMMLFLGIRKGEALGLRVNDLNLQSGIATIHRTPDDPQDNRLHQPQTKTRGRQLPMNAELVRLCQEYIIQYRAKNLTAARKNHFLFVETKTGNPLSIGAVNDIFRTLVNSNLGLPKELSAHVLRHTWNDRFSEIADVKIARGEWTAEDERKSRCEWMGWVLDSKMAWNYSRRHIINKAHKAGLEMQESLYHRKKEKPDGN